MVHWPHAIIRKRTSYPLAGAFYPKRLPSKAISFVVQQPTPPSPLVTALPANWIKVPQRSYDHGKKQCNFQRSEPVSFRVNGRPGINMGDAFRKTFTGLDGRDSPVLQDATGAISCRLLVGLLWLSIRSLTLTPSKVPRVSSQQRSVPGTSTSQVALSRTNHGSEDPRIELD